MMGKKEQPQDVILNTEEKFHAWTGNIAAWNAWCKANEGESFAPLDSERSVRLTLINQAALALFKEGRSGWNLWIAKHPNARIEFNNLAFADQTIPDFSRCRFPDGGVTFSGCRFESSKVSFKKAEFGTTGKVNFCGNNFGDCDVDFSDVDFGTGDADFWDNTFGNGNISFVNANFSGGVVILAKQRFGDGDVRFDGAVFGDKGARFDENEFGAGKVSFKSASFAGGLINFHKNFFGTGLLDFSKAKLGGCDLSFEEADFGDCDLRLGRCEFGTGTLNFRRAKFGKGKIDFAWAQLGETNVVFDETEFGETSVDFSKSEFGRPARFDRLKSLEKVKKFSFEGCSYDKLFTFSHDGHMGSPLDLRRTSIKHDVVVHDIRCDYVKQQENGRNLWPPIAADPEDSQRFRKLKELAVANRNHSKALEFHAQEIRSARGHGTVWWQDALQFFYWGLSDYGRNVIRPVVGLLVSWCAFAGLFWTFATEKTATYWDGLALSGSNLLAFVPTGRTARAQGEQALFGSEKGDLVPGWALGLSAMESILAVVLLFLLGLGLRNMFRV